MSGPNDCTTEEQGSFELVLETAVVVLPVSLGWEITLAAQKLIQD
jgi:hypothetical protein